MSLRAGGWKCALARRARRTPRGPMPNRSRQVRPQRAAPCAAGAVHVTHVDAVNEALMEVVRDPKVASASPAVNCHEEWATLFPKLWSCPGRPSRFADPASPSPSGSRSPPRGPGAMTVRSWTSRESFAAGVSLSNTATPWWQRGSASPAGPHTSVCCSIASPSMTQKTYLGNWSRLRRHCSGPIGYQPAIST